MHSGSSVSLLLSHRHSFRRREEEREREREREGESGEKKGSMVCPAAAPRLGAFVRPEWKARPLSLSPSLSPSPSSPLRTLSFNSHCRGRRDLQCSRAKGREGSLIAFSWSLSLRFVRCSSFLLFLCRSLDSRSSVRSGSPHPGMSIQSVGAGGEREREREREG